MKAIALGHVRGEREGSCEGWRGEQRQQVTRDEEYLGAVFWLGMRENDSGDPIGELIVEIGEGECVASKEGMLVTTESKANQFTV